MIRVPRLSEVFVVREATGPVDFDSLAAEYVRIHNEASKELTAAFKKIGARMWRMDHAHPLPPRSRAFIANMMRDNYEGDEQKIRAVYGRAVPHPLTVMDSYPEARKHRHSLEAAVEAIVDRRNAEWKKKLDAAFGEK